MVTVYILQSLSDNGFYIGIATNIDKRLIKHNSGQVQSTRKRKPFRIIHKEEFENYSLARQREKEIKSYKGGNALKELINLYCRVV